MTAMGPSHARLLGPVFAAVALVMPTLIGLFDAGSLNTLPAQWIVRSNLALGGSFSIQYALLTAGLSAGLVSGVLALYHRSLPRRLLHLILLSSLLELFYRWAYGGAVTPGVLLSVTETSQRESGELLAGHPALTATLAVVALLAIYTLVVSWSSGTRFALKRCLQVGVVSISMIVASLAIGVYQIGSARQLAELAAAEFQATFPFDIAGAFGSAAVGLMAAHRQAATRASFLFPGVHMVHAAARRSASEIYVVVIGETSRRMNWSLFGYPRPTTPRLAAIKDDLILFNHVTANATNTILSVPLTLTRAAPATRDIARSEKSVITLLRQAGFETYWISNQERSDAFSNPISQIALEADHVSFPEDVRPDERAGRFDSNLLARLNDALAHFPAGGKAVFFLHMEGSHFGYKDRYPASFARFPDGRDAPRILTGRQMRLVDEYDNSVYFTDYVVRGIIDRLASCECKAGLMFFSDHGERLFDNGSSDNDFGHGFPSIARQEITVPLLLWLSSEYQRTDPELVGHLKANSHAVGQLHNVFETIVDLAGVDYANRAASLSLFSDQFTPPVKLDVLSTDEEAVSLPLNQG